MFIPKDYGLGWNADAEDRDVLHSTATPIPYLLPYSAPDDINHRQWLKVRNQGRMGSCVGHGRSAAAETCNYIDTAGGVVRCSAMWSYITAQKRSGLLGRDVGATITGAVQSSMADGECLEETFPYTGTYSTAIPPAAASEASGHRIVKHSVMRSYADVFNWIASGQGVVIIGVRWTAACAESGGVIEDAGSRGGGGHCVLLCGYPNRRASDGRKYIDMLNSHGTGWGDKGWSLVAPRVIEQWLDDRYSELIGVSDIHEWGFREVKSWQGLIA